MDVNEIEKIISRIVKDFSYLIPGLSVDFLKAPAYQARVVGRLTVPGDSEPMVPAVYPLHSLLETNKVLVCIEEVGALLEREAYELRRPLVEGLILNEILYIAISRGPEPDPRSKAESILSRYWPLQYVTLFGRTLFDPSDSNGGL
jgi:hypothetical protein